MMNRIGTKALIPPYTNDSEASTTPCPYPRIASTKVTTSVISALLSPLILNTPSSTISSTIGTNAKRMSTVSCIAVSIKGVGKPVPAFTPLRRVEYSRVNGYDALRYLKAKVGIFSRLGKGTRNGNLPPTPAS